MQESGAYTTATTSPDYGAPRRGRPPKELHTSDFPVGQQPSIALPDDGPVDREQIVLPVDRPLANSDLAALAFAEDPITINISKSAEKFAPKVVDCWVNGKGIEIRDDNGRWISLGAVPVGVPVTTKRKYAEVLARSKVDNIDTSVEQRDGQDPINQINRSTYSKVPFSVLRDDNPAGHEWLRRLMAEG